MHHFDNSVSEIGNVSGFGGPLTGLDAGLAERLTNETAKLHPGVGRHLQRTGIYAGILSRTLAWSPERIEMISTAAPLHDVGKLGIAPEIINKPGELTEDEQNEMRRHPLIGHKMLSWGEHPKCQGEAAATGLGQATENALGDQLLPFPLKQAAGHAGRKSDIEKSIVDWQIAGPEQQFYAKVIANQAFQISRQTAGHTMGGAGQARQQRLGNKLALLLGISEQQRLPHLISILKLLIDEERDGQKNDKQNRKAERKGVKKLTVRPS